MEAYSLSRSIFADACILPSLERNVIIKVGVQEWVNANTIYHAEPIVLGTLTPVRAVAVEPTATEAFIAGFKAAQSLQDLNKK